MPSSSQILSSPYLYMALTSHRLCNTTLSVLHKQNKIYDFNVSVLGTNLSVFRTIASFSGIMLHSCGLSQLFSFQELRLLLYLTLYHFNAICLQKSKSEVFTVPSFVLSFISSLILYLASKKENQLLFLPLCRSRTLIWVESGTASSLELKLHVWP